jgi:ADP-heptose:LPS heptosyltransferase
VSTDAAQAGGNIYDKYGTRNPVERRLVAGFLGDLTELVAAAGRVLSTDTGIAHLATGLGTPSVTLYGPTPPAEWGPPADPRHAVLWAGRRGDPHADAADAGLLEIAVGDVVAALGSRFVA